MKDHISVCICTYRRNRTLEILLRRLAEMEDGNAFAISIVVVDNDRAGGAEALVAALAAELHIEIRYAIEPCKGIPAARNRAVQMAPGNFIAIIDDDEFPPPEWLVRLYRAVRTFNVHGALGPVFPFFETHPPMWLVRGRFCERPVIRTGTLLKWHQTRTGNVLIKKEVFTRGDLNFDPRYATGGSDKEFFKQAMKAGYTFVAVEEAPVYEIVPPERWTPTYFLKRAIVNGYNANQNIMDSRDTLSHVRTTLKSLLAVIVYAAASPFCLCIGSHALYNCLQRGAHHMSRLFAIAGIEILKQRDF